MDTLSFTRLLGLLYLKEYFNSGHTFLFSLWDWGSSPFWCDDSFRSISFWEQLTDIYDRITI